MEAPAPREAILPWRRIARLSLLPALVATAICWVGWTVEPVLSVAISVLLAIVGGASAMLWSIWLVVRRRRLDESFWRKESGRVAVLVLTLVLLVPANLVPTVGKRRLLMRQGRVAARAIEEHRRIRGSYPAALSDAEGGPWYRGDLRYTPVSDGYELWFPDPGLYFMDSARWEWNARARRWSYALERF